MRRVCDLALLPFALVWMLVLLALVMLHVVDPDRLARNVGQAYWPPAEPRPDGLSSAGTDRVPASPRAAHPNALR